MSEILDRSLLKEDAGKLISTASEKSRKINQRMMGEISIRRSRNYSIFAMTGVRDGFGIANAGDAVCTTL